MSDTGGITQTRSGIKTGLEPNLGCRTSPKGEKKSRAVHRTHSAEMPRGREFMCAYWAGLSSSPAGLAGSPNRIFGPSAFMWVRNTLVAHVNTHGNSVFPAKMRRQLMASFLSHVQLQEEEAEKDRWTCRFGTVRPRSCSTLKGLEGIDRFSKQPARS